MSKHSGSRRTRSSARNYRNENAINLATRRLAFEDLEQRQLLSTVGLTSIPNVTVPAGASVLVALNGNDSGNTVKFAVTSTDPTQVTPILMPSTNESVQFTIANYGTMTYQLFDNLTPNTASHIEALVNGGYYNGAYIYRAETGSFALIQGGNDVPTISNGAVTGFHQIKTTLPTGVTATINEEFNPDLSYTTAGDLAMARSSAPNSSGTEFFMTDGATPTLDYAYSLFGFQTQGASVLQQLDALPTIDDGGIDYLATPVQITSASIIADTQDGVLMLRAPSTATGSYTVNVTAYDGTNTPTTQSFTVNVVAPTASGATANPWASATPTAPTSVVFEPQSGQGTTSLTSADNSSTAKELQFLVSGTTSGDSVTIYANGVAIGSATATGTTTTVTTDGTTKILTGANTITATQTALSVTEADSGDSTSGGTATNETSNVDSVMSPAVQLNVISLAVTSTPVTTATVGQVYTYMVQTNAPGGDTVTVTPGSSLPTGMTFDSSTNTFTWTPTSSQAGTEPSFTGTITDTAGNSITLGPINVLVLSTGLTVLTPPASIAVGSPVLVAFSTADVGTPNFSVTTSNNSQLTATLMPATNQVLQIDTSLGNMDFELLNNYAPNTVAHFVSLVDSGTYNTDASFYRIIENFMDQGGVGGTGSTIPVELNPNLRFTSSGLLALANDGVDGNGSEFFITNPDDMSDGFLDFRYTLFGKLISGDNVRQLIASTPVTTNTATHEDSEPLTPPKILSMSIVTETDAGVFMLKAATGATGSYTVTVSDGLGGSQNFTINVGTNPFDPPNPWVAPINGTDTITTAANTAAKFTPQGESANNTAVQVSAQLLVPLVGASYSSFLVDNSYTGTSPSADTTNPSMTLTQSGSTYTVTPVKGDYGVQVVEVMGFTPVSGTFELQVGSTTTAAITFDSTNLTATAANIQSALRTAGFTGATVAVASSNTPPEFNFNVVFAGSEADITYQAASTALPITFANSATTASADQELTFTASGTTWDSSSNVNPVYRAFVPVYVSPPPPVIASVSAGGKTVSGSTLDNNSTTASELSFVITGAVSGATVSVFLDGGTTPIATGTVGSSATTITVTTNGSTKIAGGNHVFTVEQSLATAAYTLYADWTETSQGLSPGAQFAIPASSVTSPASTGTTLTVGLAVLAQPASSAQVGVLYTYVVQTNAPSGDTVTVTPVTLPSGMVFTAPNTFNWTPTNAQLNTAPAFSATVSDTLGNSTTIGPVDISVIIGLAPTQIPVNTTLGGSVTVIFSGNTVEVYNNVTKSVLSHGTFRSSDTIEIDAPSGQANSVTVMVPSSSTAPLPQRVFVNGASGAANDSVTVSGTNGVNNFNLAGATDTDNGLATQIANVQKLTLTAPGGNSYYTLTNSIAANTVVVAGGSNNTLDFSHDTAGVDVNLKLDAGQSQYIAPWGHNLSIQGVISFLTGSEYPNVLIGGPAATTFIRSGASNSTVVGGSGNNVLIGGGGNDTITGGPGKNLIIAGMGTDTIYADGWENMVFGGVTSWNSNDAALLNLLAQGSYASYGYSYRRALTSIARNPALAAGLLTFQDSGAVDTIFGSNANDWYILGKYDKVHG